MREAVLKCLRTAEELGEPFLSAGEVARALRFPRARVKAVLELLEGEGGVSSKQIEFYRNGALRLGKAYGISAEGSGRCQFVVEIVARAKGNPYRQCLAPAEGEFCAEHRQEVERTVASLLEVYGGR